MSHFKNIKLSIEYDGTNYSGWQVQNNAQTIHGIIEKALFQLLKEHIKIIGASRTDKGVHAYGQIANFFTTTKIPGDKFLYALNPLLPKEIIVKDSEEVSSEFHARFSSIGKTYEYLIFNRKLPSPIFRDRAYHVTGELSLEDMKMASQFFLGTHDFKGFRASKCSAVKTYKTIQKIDLVKEENLIRMEITGDGFLYNMVRIIVGTLLDVGLQKISCNEIPRIIDSKDRRMAGKTAPACGLYLREVYYNL